MLQDIYIARAEGELALEEELYWCVFTSCCLMLVLPPLLLVLPPLLLLLTPLLLLLTPLLALLLTPVPNIIDWQCNVDCCRALISVYRQPNIMFELTKKND